MKFKIKNLTTYKKANYPSNHEPERLDLSRYSFPFSKGIKIATAATVVASVFPTYDLAIADPEKQPQPPVIAEKLMGEVAIPALLTEKQILPLVKKIFVEEGLSPKENVMYKDDKVACELDLYDAEKKVGFEFVEWTDWENGKNSKDKYLSRNEHNLLNEKNRKDAANVLSITNDDGNYRPQEFGDEGKKKALLKMEEAVRQFIKSLKEQGNL